MPRRRRVTGYIELGEVRRELSRRRLIDFIQQTKPDYLAGWFHRDICNRLERFYDDVLNKRSPRLMLFAPPRHGKSEIVSRRFPAWALGKNPDLSIIAASYSATIVSSMNSDVQRIINSDPYRAVFPDTTIPGRGVENDANKKRNTELVEIIGHSGSYRAAGVGGGITGMGAHVLLIDDPIKDAKEAGSPTIRNSVWDWYLSTAYTRLEPGGGVLLIMTRWHPDDLAGRLLNQMETGDGDKWEVVCYPAIAEEDEPRRKKGEALHPERYDVELLRKIKAAIGSRIWESMYQQRPTNRSGGLFQRQWFTVRDGSRLDKMRWIRYWDMAATTEAESGDPDYTVGALVGVNNDGEVCVADIRRERLSPLGVEKLILNTASQDGRSIRIGLEQEPGSSGKLFCNYLSRKLGGYMVKITLPSVSKELRAGPFASQAENGNVYLMRAAWNQAFIDEAEAFPLGAHDDQIDPVSAAYNELTDAPVLWVPK